MVDGCGAVIGASRSAWSRDSEAYYDRLLAAMRAKFGGHAVKKEG